MADLNERGAPVIGVSLHPALLTGRAETAAQGELLRQGGGPGGLLRRLGQAGAASVELRCVRSGDTPEQVLALAETVWNAGMTLTVHGEMTAPETAAEDVLRPLSALLAAMPQPSLTVTVHTLKGPRSPERTAEALRALERAGERRVRPALENSRKKPGTGTECHPAVLAACVEGLPAFGLCWDWGHYAWSRLREPAQFPLPPEMAFLRRVIHTHIHGVYRDTTHFPLRGNLAAARYLQPLRDAGYAGVWNLELEPERFAGEFPLLPAYADSIACLREQLARPSDPERDT